MRQEESNLYTNPRQNPYFSSYFATFFRHDFVRDIKDFPKPVEQVTLGALTTDMCRQIIFAVSGNDVRNHSDCPRTSLRR